MLAAAVLCKANAIVTDNKKHFRDEHVARYNLEVMSADEFPVNQYHLAPEQVAAVLDQQAARIWSNERPTESPPASNRNYRTRPAPHRARPLRILPPDPPARSLPLTLKTAVEPGPGSQEADSVGFPTAAHFTLRVRTRFFPIACRHRSWI